jgi:hypothetical protein
VSNFERTVQFSIDGYELSDDEDDEDDDED